MPRTKQKDIHDIMKDAFAFFNKELFDNRLPECVILVHRSRTAQGYFWADKWSDNNRKAEQHEIAMNPEHFLHRTTEEILSTLVHEMTHLEQQVEGSPGNGGYHNKEWVTLMERVGLMPYATKEYFKKGFIEVAAKPLPVEKQERPFSQVGTAVTHIIIPRHKFAVAVRAFLKDKSNKIKWGSKPKQPDLNKRASKTKYTCPDCGQNAWAKPDANLYCGICQVEMYDNSY